MIEDSDSPKLPPLPTFQRVGKKPVVKIQKAVNPAKKKLVKRVRKKNSATKSIRRAPSGKAKSQPALATQVAALKEQIGALLSQLATSHPLPATAATQSPATSHAPPVTAAEQLSTQVAALQEQIAAERAVEAPLHGASSRSGQSTSVNQSSV
jgi:hypothetical protein